MAETPDDSMEEDIAEAMEEDEQDSDGEDLDEEPPSDEDEDEDEQDSDGADEPQSDGEEDELPPRVPTLHEGPCDEEVEATASCYDGGDVGAQYCWLGEWGPCFVDAECQLGDVKQEVCWEEPEDLECVLENGAPAWERCGFTPLVLSFDGQEPVFDAGASAFELSNGSGQCLAREMPGPDTPWLAIDLDGSGAIENGRELFGSASPMPGDRPAADGFEALAVLDSDADGQITPRDDAWGQLLLWSDLDGDRASSPYELVPVEHSGLRSIALGYTKERRCDERGNCGIERSQFSFERGSAGVSSGTVIDVHIPCD